MFQVERTDKANPDTILQEFGCNCCEESYESKGGTPNEVNENWNIYKNTKCPAENISFIRRFLNKSDMSQNILHDIRDHHNLQSVKYRELLIKNTIIGGTCTFIIIISIL